MNQFDLSRRGLLKLAGAAAVVAAAPASARATGAAATAKLFYTEAGKGRNLMLLHGWTCDSHDWSFQLPVLESRYRVVAPDLRGHGRSEVMPQGAYTPDDYASDIEALISTRYPGQTFIVAGHSMGGQIAARLAAKRPDLVSAVISVDGALGFDGDAAKLFDKATETLRTTADPAATASALFRLAYDATTDPALKRWHARRAQGTPAHVVRESWAPLFTDAGQVGTREPSADFCKRLTVPVYHLCRDPAQAKRMRPWFGNAKSKVDVWANAGHWIMQDRRDDVNAALTSWIDAL